MLPAPRVHLQVRIRAQATDLDERRAIAQPQALLGAAVRPPRPGVSDEPRELVAGGAAPQRPAKIDARLRVEAEIPYAVGGQPAPVAARAEWLPGGGGGGEQPGGGGGGADGPRPGARRPPPPTGSIRPYRRPSTSSISARLTTCSIVQCVAPPTSMYSMKRTSAGAVLPNSLRSASSSSLTPRMTTVSSFVPLKPTAGSAAMPA